MQMQMEVVTQLGPYDVLFGRGSGPNDHEGNVRFRKLVAERKSEYMATNHRLTKAKIAKEIVEAVFRENGRFLKKIEGDEARMFGIPDGIEAWTGVDDDTIMEKAKQALRQNTAKNKNDPEARSPIPGPGMRNTIPSMFSHQMPHVQLQGVGGGGNFQHMQQANNMGGFGGGGGGGVDDLEPIPIPSHNYDDDDQDDDDDDVGEESLLPTPVREVHQGGVNVWGATGNSNPVATLGLPNQGTGGFGNMNPPAPVQQQRFPFKADAPTSSGQNSMLPPAARAPSMRSSGRGVLPKGMEKSMDMGDLMDSFSSKTRIAGVGGRHDMGESTDTMGTIEPLNVNSSTTDMSIATFNSAVFSVQQEGGDRGGRPSFRLSNERSFNELLSEEPPSYIRASLTDASAIEGLSSDFLSSTRFGLASDASMSIADLGQTSGPTPRQAAGNRRASTSTLKNVKENGYQEEGYDSVLDGASGVDFSGADDSNDGIEGMGSSSLHLLKGMLMSQDEIALSNRHQQGGGGASSGGPK